MFSGSMLDQQEPVYNASLTDRKSMMNAVNKRYTSDGMIDSTDP